MEETPKNPHLKTYIVLGTLVAVAAIIIFFVGVIYNGGENQNQKQNEQSTEQAQKAAEATQKAKELEQRVSTLDAIQKRQTASSSPSTLTIKQRIKALDALQKKQSTGVTKPLTQQQIQDRVSALDQLNAQLK